MKVRKRKGRKCRSMEVQEMAIPFSFRRMTPIIHRERGLAFGIGHALTDTPILKAVSLSTILLLFLPLCLCF